jgi:hypothetical protein
MNHMKIWVSSDSKLGWLKLAEATSNEDRATMSRAFVAASADDSGDTYFRF